MAPTVYLYKSFDERKKQSCFFIQRVATGSAAAKVPPGVSLLPGTSLSEEQFALLRECGWNIQMLR
jgi:hypothetical protein